MVGRLREQRYWIWKVTQAQDCLYKWIEATVIVEVAEDGGNGGGDGDGEERGEGNLGEVWQYGEENLVERIEPGGVEQTVAGEQMEKVMEETGEEQVGLEALWEGEEEGEMFEEEDGDLFEEDREREGAKSCLGMIWPG